MNISMFLQMAASACPDRYGLTCEGNHYSYAQLYAAANTAARRFKTSGADYIALMDTSNPAVVVALMGAAIAGIPYVPLNYRLSDDQLRALLARITPCMLIIEDAATAEQLASSTPAVVTRADFLKDVLSHEEPELEPQDDPSLIAVQLFTSGTTGVPKAAILRHEHLVSYILGSVEFMSAEEDEATLVSVPPYHIAGISAVMSGIYACRRIVQLPNFDPADWLRLCTDERVTNAFVVPTMLTRIIDHLNKTGDVPDVAGLRALAYGGGKMPRPVIERALDLFPDVNFTNAYGLTETSSTVTILGPEDHRATRHSNDPAVRARLGSVGQALPSVQIEIRDEEGNPVPANQPGEVYVRGPQVAGEYREKKTIQDDGWFPTRDAGHLDDEGYLFLSGRADDVIVRGGENISPVEIEDLLLHHDEVVDCAAVAMPSEDWGEAIALAIVLRSEGALTEEAIRTEIRAHLRSSRVPEAIRFCDELPYNETGKLLRRVVKEWFVTN
jgi:acyl-CoA synthetase (AMP-forming)/AMP-acid ligase II